MSKTESSPKKPSPDDDQKRRLQIRFGISYLISSLILLWLFQIFVLSPRPGTWKFLTASSSKSWRTLRS